MRYVDAREQIESGDVIGVEFSTPLALGVKFAQHFAGTPWPKVTHTLIAWWVDGRLYSVEMDGMHNVLRPMSQIVEKAKSMEVFSRPVPLQAMQDTFAAVTETAVRYPLWDLARIGLRLVTGYPKDGHGKAHSDDGAVCSEFARYWPEQAGWEAPDWLPTKPSPGELCGAFNHKFSITT